MDLETENRLAALLMEEARRLRQQAEKEGVHTYLQRNVRHRPNSRFLTATILGVEQANRAAEVSEMWRTRQKELELEKLKGKVKDKKDCNEPGFSSRHELPKRKAGASDPGSEHDDEDYDLNEGHGLRDDEIEIFLQSRVKRGRGDIGSRMDEPGPYLPSISGNVDEQHWEPDEVRDEWERRILGPEKPSFLRPHVDTNKCEASVINKYASSSKKHHSKERLKEERSRKKEKEKKRSKHHGHHKRRRD